MDDHGQILTYFENIFGGEIEHEVIKIVLQSCKWNTEEAIEKLLSMQSSVNEFKPDAQIRHVHSSDHEFPKLPSPHEILSFSLKKLYLNENAKNVSPPIPIERRIQSSKNHAINKINNVVYIKNLIKEKGKILLVMRGLPGCGKSTLAKELRGSEGIVLSTDDYFYDSVGNYNFKMEGLSEAHNWNKRRTKLNLQKGVSPIIIDNTNLQLWEFKTYIQFALDYGYFVDLLEPETSWKYNIKELARRNSHNVSSKKIEEMNRRFDRNLTIEAIISNHRMKKNANDGAESADHILVTTSSKPSSSLNILVAKPTASCQRKINELQSDDDDSDIVVESSDSDDSVARDPAISLDNFVAIKLEKNVELSQIEPAQKCVINNLLNQNLLENNGIVCKGDENFQSKVKTNTISKELFFDMVNTFSTTVKHALKNENILLSENNETYKDDHEMYQLLSLHEDKVKDALVSLSSTGVSDCPDHFPVNLDILCGNNLVLLTEEIEKDSTNKLSLSDDNNWHCIGSNHALEMWNTEEDPPYNIDSSNTRSRRRDLIKKGNPCKWLNYEDDKNVEECDKNISEWGLDSSNLKSWDNKTDIFLEKSLLSLSYTGAIPKQARSEQIISLQPISCKLSDDKIENCSQVNSSDFMLLENNSVINNDMKVLFGDASRFVAGIPPTIRSNEPLTKCKLLLDKSSTTEDLTKVVLSDSEALLKIKSLFPDICKSDLKDVLEKCNYDIDWAVNILIDGEYKMSDVVKDQDELSSSESESKEISVSESLEKTIYVSSMEATDSEDGHKRIRQCAHSEMIDLKKSIEKNFVTSPLFDDKTRRLTGKDYSKVNIRNINNVAENNISCSPESFSANTDGRDSISPENEFEYDSREGAQYLTLEIDSLFASQLVNIFGSVSSFQMNSNFTKEDYKVILPLEICLQIHKYWSATLDGNFQNETDILDRFIRDDEELARKLQEEEDADSGMEIVPSSDVFQWDPPNSFREIVNLEKAIELSSIKNVNSQASYSRVVILKKLQEEFRHVDQLTVERILSENEFNYECTRDVLASQFGIDENRELGETLTDSEAHVNHGAYNEQTDEDSEMCEDEYLALNNPQIYRDEAQMHYELRKELLRKAQEASQNGMKAVASYYAQVGNDHAKKFKEANERASKIILNAVNSKNKDANILDLHLLHIPEAIHATQSFLSERKCILANRKLNQLNVFIITGRGKHSLNNEPRLKPAIKYFIQKEGYRFHEVHAGMLKVTIR